MLVVIYSYCLIHSWLWFYVLPTLLLFKCNVNKNAIVAPLITFCWKISTQCSMDFFLFNEKPCTGFTAIYLETQLYTGAFG